MLHFHVSVVTASPASFSYIFFAQPFLTDIVVEFVLVAHTYESLNLSLEFPNAALYTKVAFQNYSTAAHPCFHLLFSTFLLWKYNRNSPCSATPTS